MKRKYERKRPKMKESNKIREWRNKKAGIRRQMKRESEKGKKFSIERIRIINAEGLKKEARVLN